MSKGFNAVKVSDHVYWVGAVDWAVRDFHGYIAQRGSTYNAYLVMADKLTLIDTVKAPFRDELLSRIASVVDPAQIRYVVSNHSEMDHSGALPQIIEAVKPEKVFASVMGAKALGEHFHPAWEVVPVKDGESISLGNMNLTFLETRMLHWPDSMVSYLAEDKLLFSQDGFGMHLATSERFADQIDDDILEYEGAKYFANILLLYAPLVTKLLARIGELGIPIDVIAPDHGPIWRDDIETILAFYGIWAEQTPTKKAVVVYDTMWNSTALMARAIADGISEGGASVKLLPMRASRRDEVPPELLDAGALLVGSPTINNNMFPTVADILTYLKGLKPKNLIGAAFGSYGWSGEAVGQVEDVLRAMNIDLVADGMKVRYVPDSAALEQCHAFGVEVARKLAEKCSG